MADPGNTAPLVSEADLSLLLAAVKYAAEKHRDQRRKGSDASPYINHPVAVAETLWRVGRVRDIPAVTAAILHDTIEDTSATAEEIQALFGSEVLSLVQELSDDKSLPKEVRKQLQVERASHKSLRAKEIKLADKIHNVMDIGASPPADWPMERRTRYLDWTEQVVAGLRGTNRDLEEFYDAALLEAREKLSKSA